MHAAPSSSLVKTSLGLAVAALCWASVFHIGHEALTLMSPLSAAAWRFLIAGVLFLPVVGFTEGWNFAALRRNAGVLALMSVAGVFGFNVSLFYGLKETSAVNGALIVAICPALTTLMAAGLSRRRLQPAEAVGLLLGLAGVAMVVSQGSWAVLSDLHLGRGDGLVMLGAVCWALYSVLPRFLSGLSPLQVSGSTVIGGGLLMGAVATAAAPDFGAPLSLAGWLAVGAMGLFGSVVAYVCWNQGVRRLGPSRASVFMNLVPLFAALIGVWRGQPLLVSQGVGAVLVIAGVLCANLVGRQPVQPPGAPGFKPARADGGRA